MRTAFLGCFVALTLASIPLRAQSTVPTLSQAIPGQTLSPGGASVTVDVRNHFIVPGVVGTQFARFDTVLGAFGVELRNDVAPRHVANFLAYAQANAYTNTFIHRSYSFDNAAVSIVQGGGYRAPLPVSDIPKNAPVPLEYNLPNARGTLAAARSTDVNSATSEWYFNVRDNSTFLNTSNGGGYTVFGRVLGTGMTVVDAMAALPRGNAGGAFTDLPVRNYTGGDLTTAHLVVVNSVSPATLFPTGGGASILEVTVQNSASSVVSSTLSGSTLTLAPVSPGTANITVRVADLNGNAATTTFAVSISSSAPSFTTQPTSQTVAAGSTVVFNAPATGAASYRWEREGVVIPGANSGTLVINNATVADAGRYVNFAANSFAPNGVPSATATLTVKIDIPLTSIGRLVNLSILTLAGSGTRVLTMGAVVGRGDPTVPLPLVIRAVGPSLQGPPFNVSGVLPDPVMTFFREGNPTPIDSNDDWGGSAALIAAFRAVAAFDLSSNLDSALVRAPGVTAGGYTVQVTGKQDASGQVIAEIYEGAGERTAATPRLINLSTRAEIDPGVELAMGFVIGGQTARTVLVRGVGPSLVAFDVGGFMADPQLELFNNGTGARIAVNDDWSANLEISSTAASIAAFALVGPLSKDAALLITLPPGEYSARVSGVNNTGGSAIVEVYEVP